MSEPEEEKAFSDLIREKIREWMNQYSKWLKIRPNQNLSQKLLHILTRVIVSILVITLSPIVFILLLISFVAAG
ncbi:hypothetical protein EV198_1751 [Roseivirga ehrenbergii]|uniref:Uncharacterized protein n=1 Tax=Roseivirga ehrenbergii (strain DSM 102268 / JCM 13514 / KCTC 12282 / NCIMB 14502 / KMM 6017) TaxID=279360 RepID=A0A150XS54_ROSEK|nr:hypothetical protein [Roseivirga ehrenbergii]KYG81553.1 hypothetical protein MB14_13285 [Roseivirga ehrenbergii]TCL10719.1 hypothetical protein EV198_1751 [Roseivirga ehrenbergii]